MRQQHDSELEMELIPRQTSIGIDSSSVTSSSSSPTPSSSTKSPLHFMGMNQFLTYLFLFKYILYYLGSYSTVWFIPIIFALGTFYMYILSTNAPPLNEESDR